MAQQQAEQTKIPVLPYSLIVGQASLKLALELAYIMPRLGGVLLSGHRGTGKSTAVRAFAQMVYDGELPVTLPINATEDRVVGGWDVREMLQKNPKWKDGLLLEATNKLLYVDEINLLDDHIVNIILDVTATGKLVVARDGNSESYDVPFTLVGTMNPEEGGLRPQLLDRFGLMVNVTTEQDATARLQALKNVLTFEDEWAKREAGENSTFLDNAEAQGRELFDQLKSAQEEMRKVNADKILPLCVALATEFKVEGNRGERVLAMAARAYAAKENQSEVTADHVAKVAPLALQHRRPTMAQNNEAVWSPDDDEQVQQVIEKVG
ncbi:AAA family ATPase [Leptothoe spongobia]|uniref:AAA family ATPase n=1 Tax=Leptothoe spongobia TAU-MAC 1115 TaxID=1967444 RepID=A0A947DG52_9CYAN|nr:AAA family ATPase [Leptothoe spongobia]MBT9316442.1 AAA family ATPase [Leptothoe spongobia TAU-MAC 1115]